MIRIIIVIIIIIIRIIIQIIIIIRIIIMITTLIMMTIKIISLTRIRIMIFLLANIIIMIRISMINMLIDHLDMDYHHDYHVDHDFDDDEKAVDMWGSRLIVQQAAVKTACVLLTLKGAHWQTPMSNMRMRRRWRRRIKRQDGRERK